MKLFVAIVLIATAPPNDLPNTKTRLISISSLNVLNTYSKTASPSSLIPSSVGIPSLSPYLLHKISYEDIKMLVIYAFIK